MFWRLTLFLITINALTFAQANGQTDSVGPMPNELLLVGEGADIKDPERAVLLSAAFPGLGQIYNNKYWKVPIVFGGGAALGFGINWNDKRYNEARNALFAVRTDNIDPDNPLHTLSESTLENEANRFRRDRDFLIIGSILSYFIVMADAYVDAHLKNFPKGSNTSIQLGPSIRQDFGVITSGLALNFKF